MADEKLSEMDAADTPLDPADSIYVVQGGTESRRGSVADVIIAAITEENVAGVGAVISYGHLGGTYSLSMARMFVGPEDPVADGFTVVDGEQWIDPVGATHKVRWSGAWVSV